MYREIKIITNVFDFLKKNGGRIRLSRFLPPNHVIKRSRLIGQVSFQTMGCRSQKGHDMLATIGRMEENITSLVKIR